MAVTENSYTGNGSTTNYSFTFPYLKSTDVQVQVDAAVTTAWQFANATTVQFNTAPANGAKIKILRDTNVDSLAATFYAGSAIKSEDLNDNYTQNLYKTQEVGNRYFSNTGGTMTGDLTLGEDVELIFEGATDDAHETKLTVADPTADRTITLPNETGTILTTGSTGAVTSAMIADGTITSTDIADGTIVNADVNASAAIEGSKIQASSGSNAGTMSSANFTKLAGIETGATADQTNAEIRAAVEAASDSNVFTDADHTKLNGIETGATADQTASEVKTLIASSPLDSSHLAANSVNTSEIADNAVSVSKIADAELTTLAGMQSGTASKLADSTALTADIADLNQIDGLTKQTTISNSDASFPTSGAVVDYVAAQIAPLGGLEVIATEVAFPNTQPSAGVVISIADAGGIVVNGSGTSTTGRTVGGSTVTINNINSAFNSSTIDAGISFMVSSTGSGQVYNFHKATLKESDILNLSNDINDFGNRYRVFAGEPSSNNDEGDLVYDTNANKMKVYDNSTSTWKEVTSTGEFKYLFLCPAGGSGGPTFNGSIATYDLREGSDTGAAASVTNAAQLIVSVNGVIQKPNTGTSAPSEGFALVDANTIVFGASLPSGSSVYIIQVGSAVSVPVPGDDTVSSVKIQNGAVVQAKIGNEAINEAKLQVSNSPTNGYFLSAQSGNTGGLTWATVPAGVGGSAGVDFNDNVKARFGTGNDLEIYHSGSDSVIRTTTGSTGNLNIRSDNNVVIGTLTNGNDFITCTEGAQVELHHNYSKKLETTSSGVAVTGNITCTGTIPAAQLTGTLPAIDGSNLTGLQAGATGGNSGANAVFWENEQTVTHDYTISNNKNAGSFGPITINSGVTVTVGSGETWTIV